MANLTVNVKAKTCMWCKISIKAMTALARIRIINIETAAKAVCALCGKGLKYRVGNGKWKCMNAKITYEITQR